MMSPEMKAKVKRLRGMPEPPPLSPPIPKTLMHSEFLSGRNYRTMGFSLAQAFSLMEVHVAYSGVTRDMAEVTRGYYSFPGDSSALHFVGVKRGTEQFDRMVRFFGKPDFVHVAADKRFYVGGEVGQQDRFVFANHSDWVSKVYTVDDSQEF